MPTLKCSDAQKDIKIRSIDSYCQRLHHHRERESIIMASKNLVNVLNFPIPIFILLYSVSLMTSMSGMEIFGIGTCVLTLLYIIANYFFKMREFHLFRLGVEVPLACFLIVVYLGLVLNAPDSDHFFEMGQQRWIIMLYLLTYAFELFPGLNRIINTLMVVSSLVAIYAIFEHFTGIDLIRGDNRAVTPAPVADAHVFQSAGFFGHHLSYGYSFGQIICFPFAALLLSRKKTRLQRLGFAVSCLIIGMSLFWTYGRGVWIAVAFAFFVMSLYVSKKTVIYFLLTFGLVGGIFYSVNPGFQERLSSIWADGFHSNEDRRVLWKANLEMFNDYPWIGIGYQQNEPRTQEYYKKLGITHEFGGHAHNNYIQMLATTGILGFFCYMLFILSFLLMTQRLWSDIPETHFWHRVIVLGALGSQVAFHVGGLTQWDFGDAVVRHLYVFILAMVAYMAERYSRGIVPDDYAL